MKITLRNSTMLLEGISPLGHRLMNMFKSVLFSKTTVVKWVMGKRHFTSVIDRYWYGGTRDKIIVPQEYIGKLKQKSDTIGFDLMNVESDNLNHKADKVELVLKDKRTPYDYQQRHIEDMIDPKRHRYLLKSKPGYGKTFTTIKALSIIGGRTFILVLSKYMDKWEADLREGLVLEKNDILQVVGSNGMVNLMNMDKDSLPKFIIISTRTMYNYFNTFLNNDKNATTVLPYEVATHLGLANLVIDEAHNEFHVVYRTIISFDIKTIALSGTFTSRSKYIKRYMEDLFPLKDRVDYSKVKNFRFYIAVAYSIKLKEHEINWVNGINGYSQNKYEQLMFGNARDSRWRELPPSRVKVKVNGKVVKHTITRKYNNDYTNYMNKLILDYFQLKFIDTRVDGDKLIIYNSLTHTCEHICNLLIEHYPKLNIVKYTQEDDYDIIESADVVVSTVLSSGEAFDIANLTRVFMFINTVSEVSNLQAAGRLREIKGKDVKFYYFYNRDFPKHVQYNYTRTKQFRDQAFKLTDEFYKEK